MSFLTVINEFGMPPHSTCLLELGDTHPKQLTWYGFFPTSVSVFMWGAAVKGRVGSDDRTQYITSYVRFEVPDSYLRLAQIMIDTEWRKATYVFGIQDCVSMSAAIAKKCGLYVPIVNMTPTGLVEFLALYNTYTHYASTFLLPYPWMPPPPPPLPGEPRMRPMKELMKSDVKWG